MSGSSARARTDGSGAIARPTRGSAAGQLVYAIGDIHGCYGLLKQTLAKVAADCIERANGRRAVLVFCGDYVDRGPDSARVLEALIWLERRCQFEIHLLKGNHEQAFLSFIAEPEGGVAWLEFGGAETLASYGVTPPPAGGRRADYIRARDELLECMPASHLLLLNRLELMVIIGDYAFVHAGVKPGRALSQQREDDLLWIREGFIEAKGPFEKVIVHGHTWTDDQPQVLGHRLGLDTGSYATGVLTAVRIEDGEIEMIRSLNAEAAMAPLAAV